MRLLSFATPKVYSVLTLLSFTLQWRMPPLACLSHHAFVLIYPFVFVIVSDIRSLLIPLPPPRVPSHLISVGLSLTSPHRYPPLSSLYIARLRLLPVNVPALSRCQHLLFLHGQRTSRVQRSVCVAYDHLLSVDTVPQRPLLARATMRVLMGIHRTHALLILSSVVIRQCLILIHLLFLWC